MTQRLLLSLVIAAALTTSTLAANIHVHITPKELAQGYGDAVILAKPKAQFLGSVDRAESTEHVSVRQVFSRLGGLRALRVPAGETVAHAISRLEATGRYEFVEPDYVNHPHATPTDPDFAQQWALDNEAQKAGYITGDDIGAPAAWDTIHDAPDVIVAVVDSGIRVDHQDLAPNLWVNPSPTFGDIHGAGFIDGGKSADITDENGHGTHVAGIICAAANNGVATAGVVWRTQLMVLKNSGADGLSYASDSAACIDYAVAHGAKVINCSWGSYFYSHTLYVALSAARKAGVIAVCSAGNDDTDTDYAPVYPAGYLLDNIVTVGNSTAADAPNDSSNFGNIVDLFAPGTSILSLDYQSTTGTISYTGTSMSAPHVTGALTLLRQFHPTDTYRDAINRLLNGTTYRVAFVGRAATNGRLNLAKALTSSNQPFNSTVQTASLITGTRVNIRSNNQYSGPTYLAAGDPPHAGNGSNALWWRWYVPTSGTYVIDTSGSDYDTGLDVYTGDAPDPGVPASSTLTVLASNDNDGVNKTSRVTITGTQGQFLYICTTAAQGSAGGFTELNVSLAPVNDNFASATTLTGVSAQDSADNSVATLEPGEPAILGQNGVGSLWYKWTAPRDGFFQVSAFSDQLDALLAIYTGSSLDQLSLVVADDDSSPGTDFVNTDSRCDLNAKAGTTYYIQVESKSADARGYITTSITDSLWQLSSDGGGFTASPAVAEDGTVYVGASFPDHRLYAVAPDGSLKWSYAANGSIDLASPAIGSDGTVYQAIDDGTVVALKPDGTVRWTHAFGTTAGSGSSISIGVDGTLYLHMQDGFFYAMNPADGSVKWRYAVNAITYGSASIASDGTIYQESDGDQCLYALNPDGTLKWKYNTNIDTTFSTPAIDAAGNIYFSTYSDGALLSLTPSGTLRWRYSAGAGSVHISGSPTLSADGGTVYVGDSGGGLNAVNASNGAKVWTYPCGIAIYDSTPAIDANGVIYVGAYDGKLYAVNPNGTANRTWDTAQPIQSSPVIVGTRLYVGSTDCKLYAFDIGATLATGPWSEYRHDARRLGRVVSDSLAIVTAPAAESVKAGAAISLDVVATGEDPLAYQWKKDGTVITGATSALYTVANASSTDGGSYSVTVSSPQGTVTSAPVTVAVITPNSNPGRLTNLSIRSQAGTGSQTLIVGLSIRAGSNGNKPLLIRGVGPTLAGFGVSGAIPDPVLTVYQDKTVIQTNSGWGGDAQIASVGSALGAFPFSSSTSLDSALYTTLPAAGYTIQLTGKTDTGVALVEVYDATPAGTFTTSSARLTNVSARTQVGTGGDVLIAGFAVGGTTPEHLLIRAVGPKLADFGVTGVLADPQLVIYADKTMIGSNDNWGGGKDIADASSSVGAFALDPNSKDAVLVLTLQPGTYSAVVSGVGDTTGVALVELYELP